MKTSAKAELQARDPAAARPRGGRALFADKRSSSVAQRRLDVLANDSPQVRQHAAVAALANGERHLPHEAWHVVQQAQGRVSAPRQLAAMPVVQRVSDIEIASMADQDHFLDEQDQLMARLNGVCGMIQHGLDNPPFRIARLEFVRRDDALALQSIPLADTPPGIVAANDAYQNASALILGNVTATLQASQQFQLIDQQWNAYSAAHRIVVDVDYYPNRPPTAAGFHKDSTGQTMFVNLTFNNRTEGVATEFIRNVPAVAAHEQNLPGAFNEAVNGLRQQYAQEPSEIGGGVLPVGGRVSFVDALIYHSTPKFGHRPHAFNIADDLQLTWEDVERTIRGIVSSVEDQGTAIGLLAGRTGPTRGAEVKRVLHHFSQRGAPDGFDFATAFGEAQPFDTRVDQGGSKVKRKRAISTLMDQSPQHAAFVEAQANQQRAFIRTWVMALPR